MAEAVFDLWRYGQSAYVPSVAEMRLLYTMRKIIIPVIEQCGSEPLPLDENDCWYWTSTEVEKQQTAKAWLYSMGSGAMQETKTPLAGRFCLTLIGRGLSRGSSAHCAGRWRPTSRRRTG